MRKTYEDMIDKRLNSRRNKKNKLEKILLLIPMGKKIFMKVKYRTEVDEQAEYNGKLIPLFVPDYTKACRTICTIRPIKSLIIIGSWGKDMTAQQVPVMTKKRGHWWAEDAMRGYLLKWGVNHSKKSRTLFERSQKKKKKSKKSQKIPKSPKISKNLKILAK